MFHFLQSHLKKIFIILLFFIIPSFCLYFVGGAMRNPGAIAEVFGKKINEADFQNAYRAVYFDSWMRYGEYFKKIEKYLSLEKEAWTRIILLKKIQDFSITISDEELRDELLKMFSNLFKNRDFNQKEYEEFVVRNLNMPVKSFEDMVRDTLSIKKLKDYVVKDIKVSEDDIKKFYLDENNKLQFSYVKIESKNLEEFVEVSDEKLEAFFNKDKKRFQVPEKIKLNYVIIEKNKFIEDALITEDELKDYYETNKEEFLVISDNIKQNADNSEESKSTSEENTDSKDFTYKSFDEVKDSILSKLKDEKITNLHETFVDSLYKEMIEKNDFIDIVKNHSLEVKETDYFDALNPPSEINVNPSSSAFKDAFELNSKDFCGPYQLNNDWMIICVQDKKNALIPEELSTVKLEVEKAFRQEEAKSLAENKAIEIKQKMKALLDKKTFEEAAKELGFQVFVSGLITLKSKAIQDIGYEPEIIEQVFNLNQDELSDALSTKDKNIFIIAQVSKREPANEEIFLKDKEMYHEKTLNEAKNNYYSKWLEETRSLADLKIKMTN